MRLLMIYADLFSYKPAAKAIETADKQAKPASLKKTLVGFIHLETKDEENLSSIETKLIKNLKWAARKNDTNTIVLHSFAHLAEGKANPDAAKQLLDNAESRLKNAGYETLQTPFGYFLDLDIQAPGHSFSRLFKEI